MKPTHFLQKFLPLLALTILAGPPISKADVRDRLYDFTDAYYAQNGINPAAIDGRRQPGPLAVTDTPIFSYQRNLRALLTLPAYDHSGNAWFFSIMGGFNTSAFTANSAGQRARQIADTSPEYIFPRQGTDPVGLGALRQSVLLDMRNGYFSNNKLGLWIHTWISYTPKGLGSADGIKMQNDLARRNGRDLDGTAIIASVGEIEDLLRKGYITKTVRPLNDVLRYAICPVIKDPTDGGIARDQFLAITRKPDGSPLEREFLENFNSLQLTGRPAN
ncbi:MAG TPA: hypothetical protein VK474_09880 [Chthoniobacterales bacterium]|nr:hypothetical protein [Chthoniobacterales bacterium]